VPVFTGLFVMGCYLFVWLYKMILNYSYFFKIIIIIIIIIKKKEKDNGLIVRSICTVLINLALQVQD